MNQQNRQQQQRNQQPKLTYDTGVGGLDESRVLNVAFTVKIGQNFARGAEVNLEIGGEPFTTSRTNASGNTLFQIEVPADTFKLTFSGSIAAGQSRVTIKPFTWLEAETPTVAKLDIVELGEIGGVYAFQVQGKDITGQICMSTTVDVVPHGQVRGWLATAVANKKEGGRIKFPIGKEGDIIFFEPLTPTARVNMSLLGSTSRSQAMYTLTQAKPAEAAKPTGLKVMPDTNLANVFHLQVSATDPSALKAGIQIFSGDGTQITVKANGSSVGNPAETSADFTAAADGGAIVELAATEEAAREKDHPVYFKLTAVDLTIQGPFTLKASPKKIVKVETFVVKPQSGRYVGKVPFQITLKAGSPAVPITVRAGNLTTRLRVEIPGEPTPREVDGTTEFDLKADDGMVRTIYVTLIGAEARTAIYFDAKSTSETLSQGPFTLEKPYVPPTP